MYAPSESPAVAAKSRTTATGHGSAVPAAGVTCPGAQPQTRLRITRRGRATLTVLAAVPVVAGALLFALNGGGAMADNSQADQAQTFEYVTVHAGQSLWELAESVAPSSDPRDVISEIMTLNRLETATLSPGQLLAIPIAYS